MGVNTLKQPEPFNFFKKEEEEEEGRPRRSRKRSKKRRGGSPKVLNTVQQSLKNKLRNTVKRESGQIHMSGIV